MNKNMFPEFFFLGLFVLMALFIRGYEFGIGDQTYYLTFIKQRLNSSLYVNDYLFQYRNSHPTIFIDFVTFIIKIIGDFQLGIFLIYFVCLFFFYFFIYRLALFLFANYRIALISLFLLIPPIPIGGSSIVTFEKLLTLRVVASVFLLATLYALFYRKVILAVILAAIGFLFHPLTLLPVLLIFLIMLVTSQSQRRELLVGLALFIPITLPIISRYFQSTPAEEFFFNTKWRMILEMRMPYVFITRWSPSEWILGIIFIILSLIYLSTIRNRYKKSIVQATIFSSLSLFFLNYIGDIFGVRLPIQLQLGRSLYLPALLAIFFLASQINKLTKKNNTALFLLIIVVCLGSLWYFPRRYDFPTVKARNNFEQIADWAKFNTSLHSVFLIPPNRSGFRLLSERAVIAEFKEGADSLYSRSFALEWRRRQQLLESYNTLSENELKKLSQQLNADYIVHHRGLSLPLFYENSEWALYRVAKTN